MPVLADSPLVSSLILVRPSGKERQKGFRQSRDYCCIRAVEGIRPIRPESPRPTAILTLSLAIVPAGQPLPSERPPPERTFNRSQFPPFERQFVEKILWFSMTAPNTGLPMFSPFSVLA